MPFCLHVLLKIYINEHTPATGVCSCPRLKNNIQNPKPLWAGQQQVEAGHHFLWTVVKAGIWMGWIEWTGWNTGFFRMSESVLTEGRSWFLLMICRASCVLPTRQLSIKKKVPLYDWLTNVLRTQLTSQPWAQATDRSDLPIQWNADMDMKSIRQK